MTCLPRRLFSISAVAFLLIASALCVSAQSNGVALNVRPLRDLADRLRTEIQAKRLEPSAPFTVEIQAAILENGRLDVKATKVVRAEGDKAVVSAVTDSFAAITDAGFLRYIRDLGAGDCAVSISQSESEFLASTSFALETENQARSISGLLAAALKAVDWKRSGREMDENDKDERWLAEGTSVKSEGKNVTVSLRRPAEEFRAILLRRLAI